jgi:hypothetical protein
MLNGENTVEQQDFAAAAEPAQDWTDRYADEGDERDYQDLIHLAGDILAFVTRRLPQGPENPAEAAMQMFLSALIDNKDKDALDADMAALPTIRYRGWKAAMEDFDVTSRIDWPRLIAAYTALYAYGDSGVIHAEGEDDTIEAGKQRIKDALAEADLITEILANAFNAGSALDSIRSLASGRWALDHGGSLTPVQIARLANIDLKTVRNAVSAKEMASEDGAVPAASALEYLSKRRNFRTTHWREAGLTKIDDPVALLLMGEEKEVDYVFVPKDGENRAFLPDLCRMNRELGVPAYAIGTKEKPRYVADYYEALDALAKMPKPAWRRPNEHGNWGRVIHAGGPWDRMRRDIIDQMIEQQKTKTR